MTNDKHIVEQPHSRRSLFFAPLASYILWRLRETLQALNHLQQTLCSRRKVNTFSSHLRHRVETAGFLESTL